VRCIVFAKGFVMKKLAVLGAWLVLLWLPSAAWAWGSQGHSVVAELAQRRLTPAARAQVAQILGTQASLASLASWADDVRATRPSTYNEHFVSMSLADETYDAQRHCVAKPRGDCAVKAIERYAAQMTDASLSAKQRREALKFVVHFVGDVHQPLHTVSELGGGNGIAVTFFTDPQQRSTHRTNLHAVWDEGIIGAQYYSWGSYAEQLDTNWLAGKTPAQLAQLASGTPADWASEAHHYARSVAYPVTMNQVLGLDYLNKAAPVIDRQLAVAGLRLAALLNARLR
jgi:nuclease S1